MLFDIFLIFVFFICIINYSYFFYLFFCSLLIFCTVKRSRGEREDRYRRGREKHREPLFITAHIPSRERQGLGLRIEEIDMGTRQAVVMGEPHPWSEQNIGIMSEFERGERAKICPGQELLAINGGQLVPATLERAVELVAIAESPVQLTLRFPPEDSINLKRRRINH